MNTFISFILLGLSLAAPIGPVNAAQLDRGMKFGFLHAWLVGVGAVIADAVYMFIVYLGVVQLIDTPIVKTFLYLFGCFVLFYTGIESVLTANKFHSSGTRNYEPAWRSFFSGFMMSITNPLTILFWLGIYGSVLAEAASTYGTKQLIIYSGAIFIGLFAWDIAMALASSTFRRVFKHQILTIISIISGISLIGFGGYFLIQGIKAFAQI